MSRTLLFLVPALVLPAQGADIPGATEVRPGVFVMKGALDEAAGAAMKRFKVARVLDLRRDGEANLDSEAESRRLSNLGIEYMRYAISRSPAAPDFDFIRTLITETTRTSKILVHCDDGNRAAAVVCAWLVLDRGVSTEEALRISRQAGLKFPETETALKRYLSARGKA